MKPITKEQLAEKMEESVYNFIDAIILDYDTEEEMADALQKCIEEHDRILQSGGVLTNEQRKLRQRILFNK